MLLYYQIVSVLSLLFTVIYVCRWNKRYSTFVSVLFVILPIACYGYLLIAQAQSLELAYLGTKISYIGGIFGTLFFVLSILELCKVSLQQWIRILMFIVGCIIFGFVMTIGNSPLFYKSVQIINQNGIMVLAKEYGPLHITAYIYSTILYIICFVIVCLRIRKRYEVSKKSVIILLVILTLSFVLFFGGRKIINGVELVTIGYLLAQFSMIILPERFALYDVNETLVDVAVERGDIAVISFDKKNNFLGCNEVAKDYFPIMSNLKIDDSVILQDDDFLEKLHFWIKMINKNKQKYTEIYERDDKYYLVVGDCIRKGKRIKGHSFMITDNTDEIKYQKIIEDYNKSLKDEVDKKTHEIMHINDVFGKNVSPQIRDYLLKGNVKLGGENCNITIMFCDIRSFTTLSENMSSEKIVKMLNFYFTQLERCISAHNGVINKYMGDAIMALFGAPMPSKTHQMDAFAAALDMRRTLKEINKQFNAKGYPELQFGIGIHSGSVLAGNIGALNRMEYTVIGDAVNAASRIEGLCKTYKKDLLMSEDTALEIMTANPQLVLEFVDFTELRGRKEKVRLFTD